MKTWGPILLCAVLLLVGCGARSGHAQSPEEAAASEAAALRSQLPSAAPNVPGTPVPVPPQPAALVKNRIFTAGQLTSTCTEPAGTFDTVELLQEYYAQLVDCLNKAWGPVVRKAGFSFRGPRLSVLPRMPSGYSDNAGYYQDGHIYIVAELDLDLEKKDPELNRVFRAFLIAHEYGHHLQALTGVFAAKYERDATLNGVDARWQENRRMELQADCLGGAFLGAAKKSFGIDAHWVQRWNEVFTWFEDPASDHGQGTTRQTWAVKGLDAAGPAACNTYQAAPIEVR